MKRFFYILWSVILLSSACFALTSCDKDDDSVLLTYKVDCNNPNVHVRLWQARTGNIYIMGHWEKSFKTEGQHDELFIRCEEDPLATIRCRVYINGMLVQDKSGSQWIEVNQNLKL